MTSPRSDDLPHRIVDCLEHLGAAEGSPEGPNVECARCRAWAVRRDRQVRALEALRSTPIPGAAPSFEAVLEHLSANATDRVTNALGQLPPAPRAPAGLDARVLRAVEDQARENVAPEAFQDAVADPIRAPHWLDQRVRAAAYEIATARRPRRRVLWAAAAAVMLALPAALFWFESTGGTVGSGFGGTSQSPRVVIIDTDSPLDPSLHLRSIVTGDRG